MHERRKEDPGAEYGISGEPPPYQDWDNPEDFEEDAPEGYYDDEEDDTYVPGPGDPDYDLSEAAGYSGWEEPTRRAILPQWLIALFSIALILAIVIPLLIRAS
jgi:hypothetical protein